MDIVLALSLLLATGFGTARLVKLVRLPAVTGYIIAGLALGPSGFELIGPELSESRLVVFTNIAMMLVAFGIGERFDLQQLRRCRAALVRVSAGECGLTFLLVLLGVSGAAFMLGEGGAAANLGWWLALGLISASIAVATAPASTVAVLREIEASGPVSRLLLSNVVVNNAVSVTLFGVALTAAAVLLETHTMPGWAGLLLPLAKTLSSLFLGMLVGWLIDWIVHRLIRRDDVLIVALAAVFFCGGLANHLGLSSLLAGVAAGFAVVNRDRRDVRAFRALNDFEPPIYGIFFALAGAQLHLAEMASAGLLAGVYIITRSAGKYLGAWWGGWAAGLEPIRAKSIGLGLLPQAGLAIALAYIIRQEPSMAPIRSVLLNIVIASVVFNELVGPPLVSWMASRVGEVHREVITVLPSSPVEVSQVQAWEGPRLAPVEHPDGYVLFGLSHPGRAVAMTRVATLLSHQFKAKPLAVRIVAGEHQGDFWESETDRETLGLFQIARQEAQSLGYPLDTYSEFAEETAEGIVRAAESVNAQAVILGHPLARRAPEFARIVDAVARDSLCPVVVAKIQSDVNLKRVLVPISAMAEIPSVLPLVMALRVVEGSQIHFLRLMPHEASGGELAQLAEQLREALPDPLKDVECHAAATESRVHRILEASRNHDIVVMSASDQRGLRRVFFGSLAEDVALRIDRPMLLVRGGMEWRALTGWN
jgi:Kef-type K+ transport system membrane component KefB/nucleotide-binding universal stress UspA family protein